MATIYFKNHNQSLARTVFQVLMCVVYMAHLITYGMSLVFFVSVVILFNQYVLLFSLKIWRINKVLIAVRSSLSETMKYIGLSSNEKFLIETVVCSSSFTN